jgi:hypothetical protein
MKMKSIKILAALALAAIAFAPVAEAQVLADGRPASCNQKLVNCIEQATIDFDCCAYAADRTTAGLLSDYCSDAPLAAFGTAPGLTSRPTSVPVCLLNFNVTTTFCNVRYAVCVATNPGGSSGGGAGNQQ